MTAEGSMTPSFQTLFEHGTQLLHMGDAKGAESLLEQAHQLDPDHADAAINLSGAYILNGKFKKAVPLLEAMTQQTPRNAMIWTNLGAAHLGNPVLARNEEQQKAISAFKRALAIDPQARGVAYNIGLIYRDLGEPDEAAHWFREALKVDPNDKDAHNNLKRLSMA